MKKIRVLQFTVANSKGGSTQLILQWWKYIDRNRFHFDFVTMSKTLDFADKLEAEGSKVFYISCYAEDNEKKFTNEMRKILLEGDYDVVHLHTKFWKSFIVERLAKETGVRKIIVHAHNTGIDTSDEKKREGELEQHNTLLKKLTADIATDYWTCSKMAANFLFGNQIPENRVTLIKNAIELSRYGYNPKVRQEYRNKFGITDEFVIGNVGRLVYQKNQEFLIDVFYELFYKDNFNKEFKLLLVGSGDREDEYKEIVKNRGLEDKVIFVGQRTDVPGLLQAMDIFCLPSRFEGLGIVLIEAQASGLPCITSDIVPKDAIINDNVVQVSLDKYLWKKKILEYGKKEYSRKDERQKLAAYGYDIEKQIKQIEDEYER